MTDEHEQRLGDIRAGPWRQESALARAMLPGMSTPERERHFRSHFVDAITDPREIAFRESFDQALDELQILELAVCSGYLPLEAVRPSAERDILDLLGSGPAREYLKTYDFLPVRFLAARLGSDLGLDPVTPPSINPDAGLRFATFLALHADFTTSAVVEKFCRLLDDYRFDGTVDRHYFITHTAEAAAGSPSPHERTVSALCLGFAEFVQILGDMFLQLNEEEVPLYGCFYAYWLGRFFGVRRTARGYADTGISFRSVSIERVLNVAWREEVPEAECQRTRAGIATLHQSWEATRALLERTAGA